jgi:hypothetical protein
MAEMFVGYVKFPSMRISTFVNTGNLMAVKILYVTPLLNIIVALLEWLVTSASSPGVSSAPGTCGTSKVFHASAAETCKKRLNNIAGQQRGFEFWCRAFIMRVPGTCDGSNIEIRRSRWRPVPVRHDGQTTRCYSTPLLKARWCAYLHRSRESAEYAALAEFTAL